MVNKLSSILVLLILCLFVSSILHAQNPDFVWAQQAGGTGIDYGYSVCSDASGNIIISGEFQDTAVFGNISLTSNGSYDIYMAKYDPVGNILWANQYGGTELDTGYKISTDLQGNIAITGVFRGVVSFGDTALTSVSGGDIFIAKYDANGDMLWAKRAGGNGNDVGQGITTDIFGNVIAIGNFDNTAAFGDGDTMITSVGLGDIFIAKYDADGNFLWVSQVGSTIFDDGIVVSADQNGNIIAGGTFQMTANIGDTTLTSSGHVDIFLAKYHPDGEFIWARRAGGTQFDNIVGAAIDGSGNVIAAGVFESTADFGDGDTTLVSAGEWDIFLTKYNEDGNLLWANSAGGTGTDAATVTIDGSGNIVATGAFENTASFGDTSLTSAGESDMFVAGYDLTGNLRWLQQAGGDGTVGGTAITVDPSGNSIITGIFEGTAFFGSTPLNSGGIVDVFIAKVEPYIVTGIAHPTTPPQSFQLYQNYPNPFNPLTHIGFWISDPGFVELNIYNTAGQLVRTLISETKTAGWHNVAWDGKDEVGKHVASGVYIYQLEGNPLSGSGKSFVQSRKMVLLR